jgi:ABC-2 type transport system ATP-binding protein
LLILDEPTSGLDPVARDELSDLLREFVIDERHSVFYSTHITSDLAKTADNIVFILAGRIEFSGLCEDLGNAYLRVSGGVGEIPPEQCGQLIGYREHSTGFEAMIAAGPAAKLPKGLVVEPVDFDQLIVFMSGGSKTHVTSSF